ncbi:sigma-E factor negative regulatory protein [Pleionea sediminis]|uniref:sigma-E factor negative regulatory protein n=1 Tax=Pleionea sediminis TaxID=2569479 RepID=UPI0011850639|nr:RseA family anti-sigma factor [Pleionea sediminis]
MARKSGLVDMKHDDVKQTISDWMDDEYDGPDSETFYQEIMRSEDGRKSFESFHAIRAVMCNESSAHWQAGFSNRVSEAIAQEPTVLAPKRSSKTRKLVTGWAVAASVALSVIVGVQWYPGASAPSGNATLVNSSSLPAANNVSGTTASDTMLAEYHVTEEERAQLERINTIFNKFSQSSNATNSGALPYVRLVSGEQVKTYRMTPKQFRQVMMELEKKNREAELKAFEELEHQDQ